MPPEASAYHEPVLLAETLQYLAPQPGETMLDATLGGGGHSVAIAARLRPGGTLIALDRDTEALEAGRARLATLADSPTIILIHADFGKLGTALAAHAGGDNLKLDGALFDLGVSSHQLDTARGFSFRRDEPLDMRMDATSGPSAADLLAAASEAEIARILWEYGEERWSRQIARALAERRAKEPIRTTAKLAALVERSVPRAAWPKEIHVATRTFQALRIAVNDELDQLREGLQEAVARLNSGGRIVVISYHSLEDRIVKRTFATLAGRAASAPGSSPAAFLPNAKAPAPILDLLTRKPVAPTAAEVARNPRARSARLRAARRVSPAP
jgi:16S rRNA (cytosine1402-N4)-methyltransferase